MKKNFLSIAWVALMAVPLMTSCGGSKPASVTKLNEEVEVSVPCSEYYTDAKFFRGQGVGKAKTLTLPAKKPAWPPTPNWPAVCGYGLNN